MALDHPPIRVLPPLALLLAFLAALTLERLVPLGILPAFPWTPGLILGLPLIAAALAVDLTAALRFLRASTPINPYRTPVKLVRSGIYRITRNPMYLGMIGLLLGLGLAFSIDWAFPAALLLWGVLHFGVVLHEEAFLTAKFGDEYRAFLASTRRWL